MTQRMLRLVGSVGIVLVCSSLLGGCPLDGDLNSSVLGRLALRADGSAGELPAAPGSYYVDEFDDGVFLFELAASRDDVHEWIKIDGSTAWFEGAGLYQLVADGSWSPADNFDSVSLDDLIQTHDPVPFAPNSSSDADLQVFDPVRDPGA